MDRVIFIAFILSLCTNISFCDQDDFDPYHVLGVTKTSTSEEIKKSYRQLAREYHPDKNKASDAQDKFIEIQQSYEILSDPDKKVKYDSGGFSGNTPTDFGQFRNFNFRDFSDFNSYGGNSKDAKIYDFENTIYPNSFQSPQLLYIYSTFCGKCVVWLRTTWARSSKEIEKIGVSTSTVDATFSMNLARRLGISQVPSIVGVYKGRFYYFKEDNISYNGLKNFVNSFLPNIVMKIFSANFESFLAGSDVDDKPRSLLFSPNSSPTLLYTLLAVKYQKYIQFGFATLGVADTQNISKVFGATGNKPTLVIFKEDNRVPAVVVKATEMYHGAINEILESNRFMSIPRITSKQLFNELCPPPSVDGSEVFRLCALLVVDPSDETSVTMLDNLRYYIASVFDENTSEWITPIYVDVITQASFVSDVCQEWKETRGLLLLQRNGENKASVSLSTLQSLLIPHSQDVRNEQERELNAFLRFALKLLQNQNFDRHVNINVIADELAKSPYMKFFIKPFEYVSEKFDEIQSLSTRTLMAYVLAIGLVVSALGNMFGSTEDAPQEPDEDELLMDEINERNRRAKKETKVKQRNIKPKQKDVPEKSNKVKIRNDADHYLTHENYESVLLRKTKGNLCILLLTKQPSTNDAITIFKECVKIHLLDPKLSMNVLNVSEYISWFYELRRSSSPVPYKDGDHHNSLHGQMDGDIEEFYDGTVLVLNGHKHWYCIFVPRGLRVDNKPAQHEGDRTYAESLVVWLERVLEGQHPRLYVPQWPGLYLRNKDKNI